jgi:conjugal transfer mating pair stabilization protein TraG
MWEVAVYGGGELYRSIFNAVALMTSMDAASSMIALAMMLGLIFGIIKAVWDVNIGKILKWYLMCAVIYGVLWVPKVTVQVVDRLNPAVTYANVANVPLGVGVTASLISRVGDRVIQLTETAFSDPADLQYSTYGMVFGSKLYSRISEARPIDQQLYVNLKAYIQDCVFYDILDGTIAPDTLSKSNNLWALISSSPNPARTMLYYTGGTSEIKTCNEVGNGTTGLLAPLIAADLTNVQKVIQKNVDPYAIESTLTTRNAGASGAMLTAMGVASQNSTDVLRQAVMANMLKDGLGNSPTTSDALASAQAEIQTHNAQKLLGVIGEKAVVNLKILIDLLFIGIFPTIFPIFLFPDVGPRMIKGYLSGFVYLQLWGPMYVILHKIMMFNSVNRSVEAMYIPGAGTELNLMNLDAVSKANDDVCALAGSMMLMIPVIAGMLTKGAMAVGAQGEALLSNFRSGAESAASSQTTGNFSYGNVSLDTMSFNNIHGNQQVTSARYDHGNMRTVDGYGNETFHGANGSTGMVANMSKMATGLLSNQAWSESLGKTGQTYQDTGTGLRHSVQVGNSVAKSHISEAFSNWAEGKEWRNSNNTGYQAQIGKMLSIADEASKYRQTRYGESESEAKAQIAAGSMGVGAEGSIGTVGGKLKGADASASITANASKTGQTTGTESKSSGRDAGLDQRFNQTLSDTFQSIATDQAQKSYSTYKSSGKGGRDVDATTWTSTRSISDTADAYQNAGKRLSEERSNVQSNSQSISSDETRAFYDWLVNTKGIDRMAASEIAAGVTPEALQTGRALGVEYFDWKAVALGDSSLRADWNNTPAPQAVDTNEIARDLRRADALDDRNTSNAGDIVVRGQAQGRSGRRRSAKSHNTEETSRDNNASNEKPMGEADLSWSNVAHNVDSVLANRGQEIHSGRSGVDSEFQRLEGQQIDTENSIRSNLVDTGQKVMDSPLILAVPGMAPGAVSRALRRPKGAKAGSDE